MKRREFIGVLGGAAGWPLMGRAQQGSIPLVCLLFPRSTAAFVRFSDALRGGLQKNTISVTCEKVGQGNVLRDYLLLFAACPTATRKTSKALTSRSRYNVPATN